ncbi:hypothetical protein TCAL_15317 [Tigriopus californicus]|uniref:Uncharacterized protein n=1 Tax=Tigriopus californicus TaxID=6832 RepID=A0A553PKL0_TIGCA|nr:uncharacterized protein LOC131890403 [Tigriopus californicus]TRY78222.1 hypothetical protein TCAL_15317 [Tigriopus californicus]
MSVELLHSPGFKIDRGNCDPRKKEECKKRHPASCIYRKVECPARKCSDIMFVEDVCKHLEHFHYNSTVFTTIDSARLSCRFPINVGNPKGPHNSFDHSWLYDGQRFFARFQQVYPVWYSWVYVIGDSEIAQRYSCQIVAISAQEKPTMRLRTRYVGPIHPIDTPKKQVRTKSANSLQLSHLVVDEYKNMDVTSAERESGFNSFLRIDYRIRKVDRKYLSVYESGESSRSSGVFRFN